MSATMYALEVLLNGKIFTSNEQEYNAWKKNVLDDIAVKKAWDIENEARKKAGTDLPEFHGALGTTFDFLTTPFSKMWDDIGKLFSGGAAQQEATTLKMNNIIVGQYQSLSDTIVGHSIVPDMINSIISWFETLGARLPEIVTAALLGTKGKGGVLGAITEAITQLKTAWDNLIAPLQTAWSAFWNGLADQVTKVLVGEKGKGGVTGAIRDTFEEFTKVGSALVDSIAKGIQDATENMVNSLVDAVKSAMRAAERAMAGWSPGTGVSAPGKVPVGFGGVPAKATGGSVFGGQSYLVGERGPELFTPSMSGSIVPNNMLPAFAFAGNSSRQINYNLTYQHSGGEMIPQSEITHLLEMIAPQATLRPS